MSDIEDQIAALKRQIADLEARAAEPPVQMDVTSEGQGNARDNRQIYVASNGSYHEAPPEPQAARAEAALRHYLAVLCGECRALQLNAFDDKDARHQQAMRLAHVYVGLHVERQVKVKQEETANQRGTRRGENQTRSLSVIEALLAAQSRRLMLLGAPGSGKSTFVNHLLLCLAEAALAERNGETETRAAWLARLPEWNAGALLPVRVILRDFAAHVASSAETQPLVLLHDFLLATSKPHEAAVEPLLAALSNGGAILLFDGLDEVVGNAVLERVASVINIAASTYTRSPVLVTCRVRDYGENPRRQIGGLSVDTLASLDNAQINQFVEAWYAELAATGRQMLGTPGELRQAIGARPELRRISGTPLLLTMMAVVHAGFGKLPDARALLYAECIDLLLLRWRKEPDKPDVLAQLGLPQFGQGELLKLMAELGFLAHEAARRDKANRNEPADLSREQVLQTLERTFATYAPGDEARRDALVGLVLREIAGRNGLLLKRSAEQGEAYAFPHRTFQEFLAGYHLKAQKDYLKLCRERAAQPHWHEALTLMVSYQALHDGEIERPIGLTRELLTQDTLEQTLAGELLNQIGRERAAGYDANLVTANGLWGTMRRTLQGIALTGETTANAALRVRAGLALGTLCYGPLEALSKPGARPPLRDPRLPLAVVGSEAAQSTNWQKALVNYWCPVLRGRFWFGDDREGKLKQIELRYDFAIGRYLITNAEYARFVADNGYDPDAPWWTERGRNYIKEEKRSAPYSWDEPRLTNPLQPVTGVTWYEAAAYCHWLTVQGHEQRWLDRDMHVRLPTSLEWEHAARGGDQRPYPWGDAEPTPEHANYNETGIGAPSPVGCFPRGLAACGALDMAGNVMEWLATPYKKDQQVEAEKDFTQNTRVLLVGGVYRHNKEQLGCGVRDWDYPNLWDNDLGFRVLLSRARIV